MSGQTRSRRPVGCSSRGCPPIPGCGSLSVCAPAGCCDEAWLKRGLPSSQQQCPPRNSCRSTTRRGSGMAKVFIGVDRHKLSATIEVVDEGEMVLATGRFGTDRVGYAAMRRHIQAWPDRVWAVEGSNGAGRPLAQRLLADGEQVVDVPAKLSARARLFDTGHNRKTDAHDAHAVAVVAVRTKNLRVLAEDGELEAMRLLVERREELARQRTQTVNRLQRLLSELIPG